MFENPRRGRQARNFTTNVPKILDLKSSSEQIFSRKLSLGAPVARSPSRVARELSNVSTVRPRFPMLTINQILGPHSVQSQNNSMVTNACA